LEWIFLAKYKQSNFFKTVDKKFKQGTSFIPVTRDEEAKAMFNNILGEALKGNFRTQKALETVIEQYTNMIFTNSKNNFTFLYSKKSGVLNTLKNSDFIAAPYQSLKYKDIKKFSDIVIKNEASKTLAVFDSFYADVKKSMELGTFLEDKKKLETRAETIEDAESARLSNEASKQIAVSEGFDGWVWGASSSLNPREEHEANYGEVFEIDEVPDTGLPGESPNCNCQMIFIKSA